MTELDKFLRNNALKQTELAKYLGCSRGYVNNMAKGSKPVSKEVIRSILDNPYGWDTTAFSDDSIKVVTKGNRNTTNVNYKTGIQEAAPALTPTPEYQDNTVPIIPLNAMAGTLNDYTDGVMPYQCERIVNPFASQATMAIRVNGDSMLPKYPNGTLVFCTKVNEKAFIEYFRTYVLDTANGVVIKQVEPSDNDDSITCVSINSKYPPFRLDKQYIYGWWKVVGCVQFE